MNDTAWFIAVSVLFVLLGIIFIRLGLAIWKKQKMELIIRHHCDRVSEENRAAYCTLAGAGIFTAGIGFILSGICAALTQSAAAFIPMTPGIAAGIALPALAQSRYNR